MARADDEDADGMEAQDEATSLGQNAREADTNSIRDTKGSFVVDACRLCLRLVSFILPLSLDKTLLVVCCSSLCSGCHVKLVTFCVDCIGLINFCDIST